MVVHNPHNQRAVNLGRIAFSVVTDHMFEGLEYHHLIGNDSRMPDGFHYNVWNARHNKGFAIVDAEGQVLVSRDTQILIVTALFEVANSPAWSIIRARREV